MAIRKSSKSRIPAQQMPDHLPAGDHQAGGLFRDPDVQLQLYTHHNTQRPLLVPAVAEPLLVLVLAGGAKVEEREIGGDWLQSSVSANDFFLTMSPEPYEMRWHTHGEEGFQVAHIYLSQRLLDLAAKELLTGQTDTLYLRDVSGARDAQLSRLIRFVYDEMTGPGEASPLYIHGIAQALAVHLVRHYRDEQAGVRPASALPAYKLQRVIKRMAAGIATDFSLAALAREAGMSDFHFSRLFRKATGQAPSQYFIQLRMEEARRLLLHSAMSVIEIALEVGYSSPSHFAHLFKRHVGMTPGEYRRGGG
ncbi:helix-turn-helix domain-containing protein [Pseudomonas sp. Pseusp122]|uniref:helix-turn-helix domain-containing protein n=1 Tax=unclassified Pseudomonas TaxID=196821 RepID=UPI0039A5C665